MNMIRPLRNAGIPLLAGTDAGFPFVLPGFGLHEELKYLVEAGLTPTEALQTATINPAIFLGKDNKLGTVEKGKLADLVILNADPVRNIRNLHFIEAVIANGQLYNRVKLDGELEKIAADVKRNE
jgi:imidazolonepropionase-like amidohydrolase